MPKKHIKILFVDFWDNFSPTDNLFVNLLSDAYDIEVSETPDYLFYSVFGQKHLKYRDCVRIFYTGENQSPDFNVCDYAVGFDHITFMDRYHRFPLYVQFAGDYDDMMSKHARTDGELLAGRDGFCSFVYSNNNASPERNRFYDLLCTYKPVASGGRFRNNVGGPVADKKEFQSHYRFSVAFENTSVPGYATEKLVQAFAAGTVPVYWGDPLIDRTFNSKAFINCHDYDSFEDVLAAVRRIDQDESLYLAMLREPALIDMNDTREKRLEELRSFLCHILDQDPVSARRYSREYWALRYYDNLEVRETVYRRSLRGIAESFYKKYFWRWRRSSRLMWKIDRYLKRLIGR